uniref:Uncharacterized protein n=1 Tax=Homalodisca liturata TaxID=320908 RepID=A0A1B6J1Y9_9HEMI
MARAKKTSDSETLKRQRDLAKERQRKHRAKMTEEELELKRSKDRKRYAKLKSENKIKKVKDMTPREHRRIKKQWRDRKKTSNLNKKRKLLAAVPEMSSPNSEHKKRGRKIVRKDRSKAHRKIKIQEEEIKKLKSKLQKYKMRLRRAKSKQKNMPQLGSPSPNKQVNMLIGKDRVSQKVKKQLFLGYALRKQLKSQVSRVNNKSKEHQLVTKMIGNKILKRYRVQSHFKDLVSYKMNRRIGGEFKYERKRKKCIYDQQARNVIQFYEDDTVSRICPGKRDFIIKNKEKKQRRVLLDYKKNLHKRFVIESNINISLSTFSRLCPFWITSPKAADRETCACIKHQNIDLKINALRKLKVISQNNANDVIDTIACDPRNEFCMMNLCEKCENSHISYQYDNDFKVKFYQWQTVKEEKVIKGKRKKIVKIVKKKNIQNVSELCNELNNELIAFKKHVYYYIQQSSKLKQLKANLTEGELLVRIDFSENYIAKHTEEIQSAHFGASKRQITLNTGLYYVKNNSGKLVAKSFCTLSDHLDHQAHAIWAHMDPILKHIGDKYPATKVIHFYSDGPSSQYKNRYNIFLMKTKVPTYFKNLKFMTWNYTEAGHGKGPMDGVGGVLKRMADEVVRHGTDITCASDFVNTLKKRTKIYLIEIDSSTVDEMKKEVKATVIPPIKNITLARQITWGSTSIMYSRSLSCFSCKPDTYCDHYTIGKVFENTKERKIPCKAHSGNNYGKKTVYHMIYSTSSSEGDDDDPAIANEERKNKATKLRIKCKAEPDKTKKEISIENNTSFVSYSSPKNKLLVKDKVTNRIFSLRYKY